MATKFPPEQKSANPSREEIVLMSAVPQATPGPGMVDPVRQQIDQLIEAIGRIDEAHDPVEVPYIKKLGPAFTRFANTAEEARAFVWNLRDDFHEVWSAKAQFIKGQQAAAIELLTNTLEKTGYTSPQDRQRAIAEKAAELYRGAEKGVRDQVLSNAASQAEEIGSALTKSGEACASAVAWGWDHFNAPLAVRMTPTLDTVTRAHTLETTWDRRPAKDVTRDWKHVIESEAEGSVAIEIACEAASNVFKARIGMTPGEIAKKLGVDLKLRAGVIDKDRDAAYEGMNAVRRYREARMPKSLRIARDEALPLVMSVHEQICGRHARYIPKGRTDYLDDSGKYTRPFAIGPVAEWLGRYLPGSPFVLPGWSPRIPGSTFREGAGSR